MDAELPIQDLAIEVDDGVVALQHDPGHTGSRCRYGDLDEAPFTSGRVRHSGNTVELTLDVEAPER